MPEIKHTFTAGRMNKDLDERLVPNGEYRHALNIQVRTTDGNSEGVGDAGVVQNLQGNSEVYNSAAATAAYNTIDYNAVSTKIVGSVADEKSDNIYFFSAAPEIGQITPTQISSVEAPTERIWVDNIIEVNTKLNQAEAIFTDRFAVMGVKSDVFTLTDGNITNASTYSLAGASQTTPANGYDQITVTNAAKYRIGMLIHAQEADNDHLLFTDGIVGVEIVDITGNVLTLAAQQSVDLNTATVFKLSLIHI